MPRYIAVLGLDVRIDGAKVEWFSSHGNSRAASVLKVMSLTWPLNREDLLPRPGQLHVCPSLLQRSQTGRPPVQRNFYRVSPSSRSSQGAYLLNVASMTSSPRSSSVIHITHPRSRAINPSYSHHLQMAQWLVKIFEWVVIALATIHYSVKSPPMQVSGCLGEPPPRDFLSKWRLGTDLTEIGVTFGKLPFGFGKPLHCPSGGSTNTTVIDCSWPTIPSPRSGL
jgi:hypothetical protein